MKKITLTVLLIVVFGINITISQSWNLNMHVFGGDWLYEVDSFQVVSFQNGFWKSKNYSNNFSYRYFTFNNGKTFYPLEPNNIGHYKRPILLRSKIDESKSEIYLFSYNIRTDEFTQVSGDTLKRKKIINYFYSDEQKIVCTRFDSLFEYHHSNGNYEYEKGFNGRGSIRAFSNINKNKNLISLRTYSNQGTDSILLFKISSSNYLTKKIFGFSSRVHSIQIIDSLNYVVSGEYGQVFSSNDGGDTWNNIGLGKAYQVISFFESASKGVAYSVGIGAPSEIFITNDSGKVWNQISPPKSISSLRGVLLNKNEMFLFGTDTIIYQNRLFTTKDITQHPIISTIKGGQPAPIGVEEKMEENEISLFPNPAQNQIAIKGIKPNAAYQVYNALGVLVYQNKSTTNQNVINTSNFNNGLYFLVCNQNNNLITRRFVVSR